MPVHIEQMTSRVDVKGDAPPMTEHQIERLVTLVLEPGGHQARPGADARLERDPRFGAASRARGRLVSLTHLVIEVLEKDARDPVRGVPERITVQLNPP